MISLASAAAQIASQAPSNKREFDHGELRIRGNTLVIGNSIYPVDNISTITFSDLRKPVPMFVWICLGLGVFCVLILGEGARVLGLVLVAFAVYMLYLNWKSRAAADYGLSIHMNGGNTGVVLGNDGDFLKAIALELYEVIELEKTSHATFNIDRNIMIDNITNSVVPVGEVTGDIVNHVQGI